MDRLRGPERAGWIVFVIAVAASGALAGAIGFALIRGSGRIDTAQAAAQRAETAVRALCFQRDDLDHQIDAAGRRLAFALAFYRSHPHGTRDFSVGVIRTAITQDRRELAQRATTRENLNILDCKEPR